MNAPSLQYATTTDGLSIACADSGAGVPFVFMPCIVQNDLARAWEISTFRTLFEPLAKRFRLIQYDGRGTGSSTRGLGPGHRMLDTLLDIEAVTEHLNVERFVLYTDVMGSYTALSFAALRPERVMALIMVNPSPFDGAPLMPAFRELYLTNWDLFVSSFSATLSPGGPEFRNMTYNAVTQADLGRLADAAIGLHLSDILADVCVPTLVLTNREPINLAYQAAAKAIAAGVANGRIVYFEGRKNADIIFSADGSLPKAIPVIQEFLDSLPPESLSNGAKSNSSNGLSQREKQVLRLIAAGRRNEQIAQELVITRSTVAKHVSSILAKTETGNRAEATTFAHVHHLV